MFPAVALVGPRQSGKTTLAKSLGGQYFDLEQVHADRRVLVCKSADYLENGNQIVGDLEAIIDYFSRH